MARFSFGIFGQDSNDLLSGQLVKIKNVTSGVFVASTSPEGAQLQLTDNNDGTYFVDGLPSGLYSVYVNSDTNVQEELQNIPFFNEDFLTHLNNSAIHRSINDAGISATDLWSAAKIIASLALKADATALAALTSTVAGKADAEHSHSGYLPASGVSADFQIESNELSFKPNFTLQTILSNTMNLNQNLELLQAAIESLSGSIGSGGGGYRVVYSDSVGDLTPSGTLTFEEYVIDVMTSTFKDFKLIPLHKFTPDSTLLVVFEMTQLGETPIAPPQVKVWIDDSISKVVECQIVNFGGNFGVYSATISIAGLNTTSIHSIRLQGLNVDADYVAKVRKVQVLAW